MKPNKYIQEFEKTFEIPHSLNRHKSFWESEGRDFWRYISVLYSSLNDRGQAKLTWIVKRYEGRIEETN